MEELPPADASEEAGIAKDGEILEDWGLDMLNYGMNPSAALDGAGAWYLAYVTSHHRVYCFPSLKACHDENCYPQKCFNLPA